MATSLEVFELLGVIGWLHPYLGLTTAQLSLLFSILKGDSCLHSPRSLTLEVRQAPREVQHAFSTCQVYRVDPSIDITVFITNPDLYPTGIWPDPLHVLEWVFLPHQLKKTATMLFELFAQLIIKCHQ